jgi:hypothetical protein
MDMPFPSIRDLARRLLVLEAARAGASNGPVLNAVRVCQALRVSLIRFAGPDGFTSLLRRSLAMAREEAPVLNNIKVNPEGCLEELQLIDGAEDDATDAAVAITAHLLGLLVTFIGESLTLRIVRETWPDAELDRSL